MLANQCNQTFSQQAPKFSAPQTTDLASGFSSAVFIMPPSLSPDQEKTKIARSSSVSSGDQEEYMSDNTRASSEPESSENEDDKSPRGSQMSTTPIGGNLLGKDLMDSLEKEDDLPVQTQ
jgi:hypothetical protein